MQRAWLRVASKPAWVLGLIAVAVSILVQPGEMESIDTTRRLQATHSFWTDVPAVLPADYPSFGLIGRGGRIYPWYGVGQSLLMLPSDIVITSAIKLMPGYGKRKDSGTGLRILFVSTVTSTLVCVAGVLTAFQFLALFGFSVGQRIAGALTLLLATTFLHYTQNLMENDLMTLLTLVGFTFQFKWLRSGSARMLFYGSTALGANVLVRLTTAMDALACAVFLAAVLLLEKAPGQQLRRRLVQFCQIALPVYTLFFLLDRLYHFLRFGSFFDTYLSIEDVQWRALYPGLPQTFPFNTPFWVGFWGPLLSPEKSFLEFEPLSALTLLLTVSMWRRFSVPIRAFILSNALALLGYIIFYARFFAWNSDSAWGDRYITTPLHLLGLITVPLLMQYWPLLRPAVRRAGVGIAGAAVVVQALSLVLWIATEVNQYRAWSGWRGWETWPQSTSRTPVFVLGLRIKNIVAIATGNMDKWGLRVPINGLPHTETPYFMPFLLRAENLAPHWLCSLLVAGWFVLLVATLMLIAWTFSQIRHNRWA